jgi:hypothetical protein
VAFNHRDAVGGRSADAHAGIRPEIGGEMSEPEEPGGKQPEGAAGDLRSGQVNIADLLGQLSMAAIAMISPFVPEGGEITIVIRDPNVKERLMITGDDDELNELIVRAFPAPRPEKTITRQMTAGGPVTDDEPYEIPKSN